MVTEGRIRTRSGLTQLQLWDQYGYVGNQNSFAIRTVQPGQNFSNFSSDEVQFRSYSTRSANPAALMPTMTMTPPRAVPSSWTEMTNLNINRLRSLGLQPLYLDNSAADGQYTPESEDTTTSSQSNVSGVDYEDMFMMHNHDSDAVMLTSTPWNAAESGARATSVQQTNKELPAANVTSEKGAETKPGDSASASVAVEELEAEELPPTFKWVHIEIV